MTLAIIPLHPLEREYIHVLRARAAIRTALLIAAVLVGELVLGWPDYGAFLAACVLFGIWTVGLAPRRRWRHLGYAYTGSELHVAAGYLFRSHTIVPVSRVQHIDIVQGPIERFFGLSALVLNTAGSSENAVGLPGVDRETAEQIRDSIRIQIGQPQ